MTFKPSVDKTLPCRVNNCNYHSTTIDQLCTSHYCMVRTAMKKGGISFDDALTIVNNKTRRERVAKKSCSHPGCTLDHYAKGFCRNHYAKHYRTKLKLDQLDSYAQTTHSDILCVKL